MKKSSPLKGTRKVKKQPRFVKRVGVEQHAPTEIEHLPIQPPTSERPSQIAGNKSKIRDVLFVVPAHLTRPYFLELYGSCEEQIRDSEFELRPILRCVRSDEPNAFGSKITPMFARELKWTSPGQIAAVVVAPTGDILVGRSVAKFSKEHRIPVIALSLPFQNGEAFDDEGLPIPPYVASDGAKAAERLGKHAAEQLLKHKSDNRSFNVLLFPGHTTRTDSRWRIQHFTLGMQSVDEMKSRLNFEEMPPCDWQRRTAGKSLGKYLQEKKTPDIIFCANDSMALGCVDTLHRQPMEPEVFVYGFDATAEAKDLIEAKDEHFFCGTVKQNMSLIADAVKGLLAEMLHASNPCQQIFGSRSIQADPIFRTVTVSHTQVPKYRHDDKDLWIEESKAGNFKGAPQPFTLKQNRTGANKAVNQKTKQKRVTKHDDQGEWGIDRDGRQWRRNPKENKKVMRAGFIWLISTLNPNFEG